MSAEVADPSPSKLSHEYDEWQGKDAADTLLRAHDIVRTPGLHRAAKKSARKQMRSLKRVADAKPLPASKR